MCAKQSINLDFGLRTHCPLWDLATEVVS
jgi:hypothetical protein